MRATQERRYKKNIPRFFLNMSQSEKPEVVLTDKKDIQKSELFIQNRFLIKTSKLFVQTDF